jgi:peroxiredoxin
VGAAYGAAKRPDEPYPSVAKRIAFLIDPEGRVARTYEVKDLEGFAGEVLVDLAGLRDG